MIIQTTGNLQYWRFNLLNKQKGIRHFISGRRGGVSEGSYHSLNVSYKVNDKHEHVTKNRQIIAGMMNIRPEELIFPDQVHSNNVKVITLI